jgi:flavorubredoxin
MITSTLTNTRVDEVASGIYRICTPMDILPGGFTFNSYLVVDEEPLLFHTGWRKLAPITLEAVSKIISPSKLKWIGGSHFESDEFGALNELLKHAPTATPFGSGIGQMTCLHDFAEGGADPRGFDDGETFSIGGRQMQWLYTPHVPHGWDCGVLFDTSTRTLLCGDLFTQPGSHMPAVTDTEILSASETMRAGLDYYAHARNTTPILERLASLNPTMLACQHGSAYRGDGAALLRDLAETIEKAGCAACVM